MCIYLVGESGNKVEALGNEPANALLVYGLLCGRIGTDTHVCHLHQYPARLLCVGEAEGTAGGDPVLQTDVADGGELEHEDVAAAQVIVDDLHRLVEIGQGVCHLQEGGGEGGRV